MSAVETSCRWASIIMRYYVYILSSFKRTTLYIGVTNDLQRRIAEHKSSQISGFTQKYRVNRLVYFEEYSEVIDAIAREKQLKGWSRKKKEALIEKLNPNWKDLGDEE